MQYGEIVQLGRHRLMCGDATKASDIELLVGSEKIDLVLTDPPYGMNIQDKNGVIGQCRNHRIKGARDERFRNTFLNVRRHTMLQGDDSSETAKKFYELIKDYSATKIFWGGQYFAHFLPVSGAWIFWHKMTGTNDFSDGELAWVSKGKRVRYYAQMWNGVFMQCDYALNGRDHVKGSKARLHPTQKPVELHTKILEDFSKEGDTVLDCFGGSGTTLIACEITGRNCLMMEISPEYCDVIKTRWENLIPLFNQGKSERIN